MKESGMALKRKRKSEEQKHSFLSASFNEIQLTAIQEKSFLCAP
jgi:hypothetical protein